MSSLFCQAKGYTGGGRYAVPHDSTIGVGAGFYWVAAVFLLFLLIGTLKAYYDDKKWTGKTYFLKNKKK